MTEPAKEAAESQPQRQPQEAPTHADVSTRAEAAPDTAKDGDSVSKVPLTSIETLVPSSPPNCRKLPAAPRILHPSRTAAPARKHAFALSYTIHSCIIVRLSD